MDATKVKKNPVHHIPFNRHCRVLQVKASVVSGITENRLKEPVRRYPGVFAHRLYYVAFDGSVFCTSDDLCSLQTDCLSKGKARIASRCGRGACRADSACACARCGRSAFAGRPSGVVAVSQSPPVPEP